MAKKSRKKPKAKLGVSLKTLFLSHLFVWSIAFAGLGYWWIQDMPPIWGFKVEISRLSSSLTPLVEPSPAPSEPQSPTPISVENTPTPLKPTPRKGPFVAIVIDDFGTSLEEADHFATLPFPLTMAVWPFMPYSRQCVKKAIANGKGAILHLPMEPKGYPEVKPGKGALLLSMNESQIKQAIDTALEFLPEVKGVNNHMGSAFTADRRRMQWFLTHLKTKNRFFVDSRTTAASVGYYMARQLNIPTAKRDVFLDNVENKEAIEKQLAELIEEARNNGRALGIGHKKEITCQVLKAKIPKYQKEGITFLTAGEYCRLEVW